MDTAAIASELACEIYGMQLAAKGIEDDTSNTTRFVVVENAANHDSSLKNNPTGDDKTTAIFVTKAYPRLLGKGPRYSIDARNQPESDRIAADQGKALGVLFLAGFFRTHRRKGVQGSDRGTESQYGGTQDTLAPIRVACE